MKSQTLKKAQYPVVQYLVLSISDSLYQPLNTARGTGIVQQGKGNMLAAKAKELDRNNSIFSLLACEAMRVLNRRVA